MKTLCGWAVGLAHVPQSGLPDLIRPARISTLLLRELSRNQVSKKTLGRRTS